MKNNEIIVGEHYGYKKNKLLTLEEIIVLGSEPIGKWRVQFVDSDRTEIVRSQFLLTHWEKRDLFLEKEAELLAQQKLRDAHKLGKKYAYRHNRDTVGAPLQEVIVLEIVDNDNYRVRFILSGKIENVKAGRLVVEWEDVDAFRKEEDETLRERDLLSKLVEVSRPHWSGELYDPICLAVNLVFSTLAIDASVNSIYNGGPGTFEIEFHSATKILETLGLDSDPLKFDPLAFLDRNEFIHYSLPSARKLAELIAKSEPSKHLQAVTTERNRFPLELQKWPHLDQFKDNHEQACAFVEAWTAGRSEPIKAIDYIERYVRNSSLGAALESYRSYNLRRRFRGDSFNSIDFSMYAKAFSELPALPPNDSSRYKNAELVSIGSLGRLRDAPIFRWLKAIGETSVISLCEAIEMLQDFEVWEEIWTGHERRFEIFDRNLKKDITQEIIGHHALYFQVPDGITLSHSVRDFQMNGGTTGLAVLQRCHLSDSFNHYTYNTLSWRSSLPSWLHSIDAFGPVLPCGVELNLRVEGTSIVHSNDIQSNWNHPYLELPISWVIGETSGIEDAPDKIELLSDERRDQILLKAKKSLEEELSEFLTRKQNPSAQQ